MQNHSALRKKENFVADDKVQDPPLTKTLPKQDYARGILWKIFSCLCFALLNLLVRYLTGGAGGVSNPLTPAQLTLLQNLVGCSFILPWVIRNGWGALSSAMPFLNGIRVAIGAAGIIMLYYGFKIMPVAQAVSLQFTGPVFTALGAWLYLREKMNALQVGGVILGITGAFIILRPDMAFTGHAEFPGWAALFPIGSAIAFAFTKLAGRHLALKGDSAELLTAWLVLFMVPAALGPALYDWTWPEADQWIYVLLLGFFSWGGHYAMAKSYTCAGVLFLMPFGFSRILFSTLLAWVAFSELPRSSAFWAGAMIIIISSILITSGEQNTKKKVSVIKS